MKQLAIAFAVLVLLIWIWTEYFRAIPHLEQKGVLKNFNIENIEPMSGTFTVAAKEYYSPRRNVLHPASPLVGSFADLAYLSNIDLLLAAETLDLKQLRSQFKLQQQQRCYQLTAKNQNAQPPENLFPHLKNLSVIAATEKVADQLRQVKAGQKIYLSGDWVKVKSAKTGASPYHRSVDAVKQGKICGMFSVKRLQTISSPIFSF